MKHTYLKSANTDYVEDLFEQYLKDPHSVDESWQYFFEGLELGSVEARAESLPATIHPIASNQGSSNGNGNGSAGAVQIAAAGIDLSSEAKVAELITAYRELGKLLANLDPLSPAPTSHPLLELSRFDLSEKDLDRSFTAGRLIGLGPSTLRTIIETLRETYCSTIAVEFTHIRDPETRLWLESKMESCRNKEAIDAETKKYILKRLTDSKTFENFLHTRYVAQKRFSLESGESLIPALDRMIEVAADLGANNVVMGMAHRGRLNVLLNIYGKQPQHILTEFEDEYEKDFSLGQGDVKYHKGFSADIVTRGGKPVHLSLAHNPSHLEFVNPVVEGVARAKQRDLGDTERTQVIPILIHGDAAFAGQGVVYETLNYSQIEGYKTGGTLHIVIDNQIGFTTSPKDSRSTPYPTDLAKMLQVPIFHVNGDDPEAAWYAARLATEYRQKFKKDVFINLICYRKYGHNEGDEPSFTQPLMYKQIKTHPAPMQLYAQKLAAEGAVSEADSKAMIDETMNRLLEAQKLTKTEKPKPFVSSYTSKWKGLRRAAGNEDLFQEVKTQIPTETIQELSTKLTTIPEGFHLHKKLGRFFEGRAKAIQEGKGIDWGNGEALAFASLLHEGHAVRLSGQDVERGTFTHRHSVLNDVETGEQYSPLQHLSEKQAPFIVQNSNLSEAGVLGFEYGWSLADPSALVIWEAQFGDFANGAQVIIDQFISSSESKWQRACGLVLLLPHGYEGQGPEHSSARLERFLQLCGQNNMTIANLTTPSQLFHALRRQIKREFRKPMVVMSPKSLLRHPMAVSEISDFSDRPFLEVLDDPRFASDRSKPTRLVLCTGKIAYDLMTHREKSEQDHVAVIRVEQLYPWPGDRLAEIVKSYPNVQEIVWAQEEPRNMGAWTHVFGTWCGGYADYGTSIGHEKIQYIGREIAAAPAVGSQKQHLKEQTAILEEAFQSTSR